MPTRIVCAHHSHSKVNQIITETESERERDAHKGLSKINKRHSYQQELLYLIGIEVLIIKMLQVATLRSVQSRSALFYVLLAKNNCKFC